MLDSKDYLPLVRQALQEDLGGLGDISSIPLFSSEDKSTFTLYAKDSGRVCGLALFQAVFLELDPEATCTFYFKDGDRILDGDKIALVSGKTAALLSAVRTALIFLSLLSAVASKDLTLVGIAEKAAKEAGKSKPIIVLDTRKTIPGFRLLQKYAVRCGGAQNHRMGLYDMVMLKDNHIDSAGGIKPAVQKVRKRWGNRFKIEVETRNLEEVHEALELKVDRIMLDNMDEEEICKALRLIDGQIETEASGNMNGERLKKLAGFGLTFISFGELTHSIEAFDFSLKAEKN